MGWYEKRKAKIERDFEKACYIRQAIQYAAWKDPSSTAAKLYDGLTGKGSRPNKITLSKDKTKLRVEMGRHYSWRGREAELEAGYFEIVIPQFTPTVEVLVE